MHDDAKSVRDLDNLSQCCTRVLVRFKVLQLWFCEPYPLREVLAR